jgi:release factor glutamine methyltransferase
MGAAAPTPTVGATLRAAIARLAAAGVPEPRADAEVMLAHALGTDRTGLVVRADGPVPAGAAEAFAALLDRRAAREPVFYLVGEREFWSIPITVDARVLIPRPETELLVETACRLAPRARRVLDLGTGSGAVAAALSRELPRARVWASDREPAALAVACVNLARHAPGAGLIRGDWLAPFRRDAFDVIVANPPYCVAGELEQLEPEVRDHEPRTALAGGVDGFDAIRQIVAQAADVLVAGGWLVVEVGVDQAQVARACMDSMGRYGRTLVRSDAAGIERVVAAQRSAETGGS